ncbi:MAG: 6-carboxytetrahydropterin synthase QueD [Spirochaetales bacterium]|nr:6-carboxytetrahydropterin synthase QueD [Spirochaetales bacterium]MCF7937860.1 6-carboxytetrahydropterin synthase QueD [Spirochaetales bacterium]
MYQVRTEDHFAAAHFLASYHGKCERVHGHNYRVRLTCEGQELDEGGMLVDFGVLKQALKTVLLELDHTNLNDHPEFARAGDPSAEHIAEFIYRRVHRQLPDAPLTMVEVFETDKNRAAYLPD